MKDENGQLLERMRRGDGVAFEALFMRHYGTVYRVLYGLLRVHEWAEDLAQETFLELYRSPPAHLEGAVDAGGHVPVTSWLCRVALNKGYNALRDDARARERIERVALLDSPGEPRQTDPSVEVLRSEESGRVRETLQRLPERQGKLLLVRHAGLSYAECAVALGVAPGSIGTLLARAEWAFRDAYMAIAGEERAEGTDVPAVPPELTERTSQ
jgi:RNA polymerase sigma-70 factor, ECF subfamily